MVEVDWPGVDERLTKHGCFAFHVFGAIVGKVFLEQLPINFFHVFVPLCFVKRFCACVVEGLRWGVVGQRSPVLAQSVRFSVRNALRTAPGRQNWPKLALDFCQN